MSDNSPVKAKGKTEVLDKPLTASQMKTLTLIVEGDLTELRKTLCHEVVRRCNAKINELKAEDDTAAALEILA